MVMPSVIKSFSVGWLITVVSALWLLPLSLGGIDSGMEYISASEESLERNRRKMTLSRGDNYKYDAEDTYVKTAPKNNVRTRGKKEDDTPRNLRLETIPSHVRVSSVSRSLKRIKKKKDMPEKKELDTEQYDKIKEFVEGRLKADDAGFCYSNKDCGDNYPDFRYQCGSDACTPGPNDCLQTTFEMVTAVLDCLLTVIPVVGPAFKAMKTFKVAMKTAKGAQAFARHLYKMRRTIMKKLLNYAKESVKNYVSETFDANYFDEHGYAIMPALEDIATAIIKEGSKSQYENDKEILDEVEKWDITGVTSVVNAFYHESCDKLDPEPPNFIPRGPNHTEKVKMCLNYKYPYVLAHDHAETYAFQGSCLEYDRLLKYLPPDEKNKVSQLCKDDCHVLDEGENEVATVVEACEKGCEWMSGETEWAILRGAKTYMERNFAWIEQMNYKDFDYPKTPIALQIFEPDTTFPLSNRHLNCIQYPYGYLSWEQVFGVGCNAFVIGGMEECERVCSTSVGNGDTICKRGCDYMQCSDENTSRSRSARLKGCKIPYPTYSNGPGYQPNALEALYPDDRDLRFPQLMVCLDYEYQEGYLRGQFITGCGFYTDPDNNENVANCHSACVDENLRDVKDSILSCQRGCNFMECNDEWSINRGCDQSNPEYEEKCRADDMPVVKGKYIDTGNYDGKLCFDLFQWNNIQGGAPFSLRDGNSEEYFNINGNAEKKDRCWPDPRTGSGRQWQRLRWADSYLDHTNGRVPECSCKSNYNEDKPLWRGPEYDFSISGESYKNLDGVDLSGGHEMIYFRAVPCDGVHTDDCADGTDTVCRGSYNWVENWENVIDADYASAPSYLRQRKWDEKKGEKCHETSFKRNNVVVGYQWQRITTYQYMFDYDSPLTKCRQEYCGDFTKDKALEYEPDNPNLHRQGDKYFGGKAFWSIYFRKVRCSNCKGSWTDWSANCATGKEYRVYVIEQNAFFSGTPCIHDGSPIEDGVVETRELHNACNPKPTPKPTYKPTTAAPTPKPTTKSSSTSPTYLGCFADKGDRALPERRGSGTVEQCVANCSEFSYIGRQWTGECWCGNEGYDKYGLTEGCDCEGSNVGGWKNCVWAKEKPTDDKDDKRLEDIDSIKITRSVEASPAALITQPSPDYILSFTIKPLGVQSSWASIIHFTTGTDGSRVPGIWFWPGTTKLHIITGTTAVPNEQNNVPFNLKLNEESMIEVRVFGSSSVILVNGKIAIKKNIGNRAKLDKVKVYVGDPWYPASNAIISDISFNDYVKDDKDSIESHVWGVNSADYIYYRNGENGTWINIGGRLKQVSVSCDDSHVWGVNKSDYIYYRNGKSGSWTNIGGRLKQVSVSCDGSHVWGVNSADYIYYRNGKNGSWMNIGGRLKQVEVSRDGSHVWGVNKSDYIYYRNGKNGSWTNIGGRLKQVSVSCDGSHVWGVNKSDYIYYRNGKNGSWTNIGGRLRNVSVSCDGSHVWGVNSAGYIYYRNGKNGSWINIGGRLKQVSVESQL